MEAAVVTISDVKASKPKFLPRPWPFGLDLVSILHSPMHSHSIVLLGLYWTGLTLLNGFSFLVNFFFFILSRAVD